MLICEHFRCLKHYFAITILYLQCIASSSFLVDGFVIFLQARKFGVRAAMPGFIARKLCPELIFVPPDFKKYTYYSDLTRKGLSRVILCVLYDKKTFGLIF